MNVLNGNCNITNQLIHDYINCEYKFYQKVRNISGKKTDYEKIHQELKKKYSDNYIKKHVDPNLPEQVKHDLIITNKIELANSFSVNPIFIFDNYHLNMDGMEVKYSRTAKKQIITPLFIVPHEKITIADKLFCCFIIALINKKIGCQISFGKLIYGKNHYNTKFTLKVYEKETNRLLNRFRNLIETGTKPSFLKNGHCKQCEYKASCLQGLIERDDISLLGNLSKNELARRYNKGYFTIYQLSHVFTARKLKTALKKKTYFIELKALALREKRVYITDIPKIQNYKTEIYLDFENLPEENFVYLIGVLIKSGRSFKQYSFWADNINHEEGIFNDFFKLLSGLKNFKIFHYGNFEIKELDKFNKKHDLKYNNIIGTIKSKSVNVLNFFTSYIYPPVYSNSLKEISIWAGFKWFDKDLDGIQAIAWRKMWELNYNESIKDKLIQYNSYDCEALLFIKKWLRLIKQKLKSNKNNVELIKDFHIDTPYKFGKVDFSIPVFEELNNLAYFDYQRTKIFFKTNKKVKNAVNRQNKVDKNLNKPNKVIFIHARSCPVCKKRNISLKKEKERIVLDLKLMQSGVKKWIVNYKSGYYYCSDCCRYFTPKKYKELKPYGDTLMNWVIYQHFKYKITFEQLVDLLIDAYNIKISLTKLFEFKEKLAKKYNYTFHEIKRSVINGNLIHADETKAYIRDIPGGYVWVFTNLESVFYLFKPDRKADFLESLLTKFDGVLVSDFYSGYDSLKCKQQKCLIHLIRDINEDLLRQPMNIEFKEFVVSFGNLLRKIVASIEKSGLKEIVLRKHKIEIDGFLTKIITIKPETDLLKKYIKRFKKNSDKLFTFINYDNIPWNNNNAEHAIRPFAKYRKMVKNQMTSTGLERYLILLSIMVTCEYKGVSFMKFLQSGDKSIERHYEKYYRRKPAPNK